MQKGSAAVSVNHEFPFCCVACQCNSRIPPDSRRIDMPAVPTEAGNSHTEPLRVVPLGNDLGSFFSN